MARIDAFFKLMAEQKASDLHLSTNNSPMLRINGDLVRVDFPPLKNDDLKAMVYEIAPEGKIKQFEETLDVDFGYEVPDVMRYRVNFFQQKYGISAAFRSIPSQVLTIEELGLPPVLKKFPMLKKGLVLVTGPTGSGKSTTLAAMIDHSNLHRHDHIITVEDPIEFVHRSQNCLVQHREVGIHTRSFANALRGSLREARFGNNRARADRSRHRPPCFRHLTYVECFQSSRPYHRCLSDYAAKPDSDHAGRIAQRRGRAKFVQTHRQTGTGRGS